VKGIYRPADNVDIKANPEILDLSDAQIGVLCEQALLPELEDLQEWAILYLLTQEREQASQYDDVAIFPIYHSKSTPGHSLIAEQEKGKSKEISKSTKCQPDWSRLIAA
jgi:hypothetical protein